MFGIMFSMDTGTGKARKDELVLFNTLSRRKEIFVPIDPKDKEVGLYTCGPTVYNYLTIGNMRAFTFADVLRKTLRWNGYKVNHVMNITDVGHLVADSDTGEDKVAKMAKTSGKTAWEIAEFFTNIYKEDVRNLNIEDPTKWVPATERIEDQLEFVKVLEEKGFTYKTSDGIYFDTSKLKDYGKLAGMTTESLAGQREGARVDVNTERRNPTDFALWKFAKEGEKRDMEWESPWSPNSFPGWHIECSAIGMKELGGDGHHFDIHTSGIDHIPIHHTNEIAQNEARYGHKTVNYWLHNEFIKIDGTRIGKSEGNALTLGDLVKKGYKPLAYRYLLLTAHYRAEMNFTWESLDAAVTAYKKLVRQLSQYMLHAKEVKATYTLDLNVLGHFTKFINDDLNTPQAVALMWEVTKSTKIEDYIKLYTILKMDEVLSLGLKEAIDEDLLHTDDLPEEVKRLVDLRERARLEGDFTFADELREQINNLGYFIEDLPDGPRVTKKL